MAHVVSILNRESLADEISARKHYREICFAPVKTLNHATYMYLWKDTQYTPRFAGTYIQCQHKFVRLSVCLSAFCCMSECMYVCT